MSLDSYETIKNNITQIFNNYKITYINNWNIKYPNTIEINSNYYIWIYNYKTYIEYGMCNKDKISEYYIIKLFKNDSSYSKYIESYIKQIILKIEPINIKTYNLF